MRDPSLPRVIGFVGRVLIAVGVLGIGPGSTALSASGPLQDYVLNCQGCHRPDGSGMPDQVPNMKGELAKFLCVPGGREFIIQVPGVARSTLSDAEITELMNWLLPRVDPAHMPNDFEPYTVAEVAALRDNPETAVLARREKLMEMIEAKAPCGGR